jgi:hypothetical protein
VIDRVLYNWAPLVALVAVGLFVVDWTLTHVGAAASKRVAERWAVEGSYELNPTWQAEVDAGRRFTWRLVGVAVALAALLLAMRYVVELGELDPAIFAAAAGAVLLLQAPTIMVHANNLQTFRDLADPTAITGSVRFSRWLVLRQAAWYLVRFAALWLVLWVPSQQAFFLGGALSCLLFARRLALLPAAARRSAAPAPASAAVVNSSDESLTIP